MLLFGLFAFCIGAIALVKHYFLNDSGKKDSGFLSNYDPGLIGSWGAFITGLIILLITLFQKLL